MIYNNLKIEVNRLLFKKHKQNIRCNRDIVKIVVWLLINYDTICPG